MIPRKTGTSDTETGRGEKGYWRVRKALGPRARAGARKLADATLAPALGSWRAGTATGLLALTLDDGPDEKITPAVVDKFAELDVTATFFLLTERAERHPELVRLLVDAGHEIALHGLDHRRVSGMGVAEAAAYLGDARDRLEQVASRSVTMFRPPYGSQSARSVLGAKRADLTVVVWSGDAQDWVDRPAAEVVHDAVAASDPGGILLFHERLEPDPRHPDPVRGAPVTTFDRVEVLSDIVSRLRDRGIESCSVGQLAAASKMSRTAWLRP